MLKYYVSYSTYIVLSSNSAWKWMYKLCSLGLVKSNLVDVLLISNYISQTNSYRKVQRSKLHWNKKSVNKKVSSLTVFYVFCMTCSKNFSIFLISKKLFRANDIIHSLRTNSSLYSLLTNIRLLNQLLQHPKFRWIISFISMESEYIPSSSVQKLKSVQLIGCPNILTFN